MSEPAAKYVAADEATVTRLDIVIGQATRHSLRPNRWPREGLRSG